MLHNNVIIVNLINLARLAVLHTEIGPRLLTHQCLPALYVLQIFSCHAVSYSHETLVNFDLILGSCSKLISF